MIQSWREVGCVGLETGLDSPTLSGDYLDVLDIP